MNIHHKFIALFNATPGAYANTPSLNDTNLLLGFIETVTGTDVTEDSDFIDHVLSNMGFVQDENADLWDTAHGAMTGLVEASGRASAVDTAIQFLSAVGTDPSSDYFTPANRFVRKASGSELATEANSTETDPEVLKAVFSDSGSNYYQMGEGSFTENTMTTPYYLTGRAPDDLNLMVLTDSVEGLNSSRLIGSNINIEAPGGNITNSLKASSISLTVTDNLDFGSNRDGAINASLADFTDSAILLNGDGNDLQVGVADQSASELAPRFTVKFTDSTITTLEGGDIRVAPGWRVNSNGELIAVNSTFVIGDDLEIGGRNETNYSSEYTNQGSVSLIGSTMRINDSLDVGYSGGNGSLSLDASDVTVENGIRIGANKSIYDSDNSASYTSSLLSSGSLTLANGTTLVGDMVNIGSTKASDGSVIINDSTVTLRGFAVSAGNADENENSRLTTAGTGTLEVNGSTINLTKTDPDMGLLLVGQSDGAIGNATFNSSTINGLRYLEVGADRNPDDNVGGEGTVIFNDSNIFQRSSETPDQYQRFNAVIGREGGVGEVNLNNSSFTTIVDSQISGSDSYFYTGWHVGRHNSDQTSGAEYDGVLNLNNSQLTISNEGLGNADIYFTIAARGSARGYAEFSNGSSLTLDSNYTDSAETNLVVSSRADTYGKLIVDASTVTISGAAMLNHVQIGNRGAGDMEITNGGSMIVTTSGDGSNAGAVRVGDKGGAGTLLVDGAGSIVGGDAYTVMTIGERPEDQYQASPAYESEATAETYAGTTGIVTLSNGALMQFGTAGDGIPDIFVGNGGSLIASDDSTVVGDIQIIGTGTVSENLLSFVI